MERAHPYSDERSEATASERRSARPENWVDELIAMTRPGVEIEFPLRTLGGRIIPFEYDDFS